MILAFLHTLIYILLVFILGALAVISICVAALMIQIMIVEPYKNKKQNKIE